MVDRPETQDAADYYAPLPETETKTTGRTEDSSGDSQPDVKVVSATSGADKYIVRVDGVQQVLSKSDIEKLGGSVLESIQRESEIHQAGLETGRAGREEKQEQYRLEDAARKLAKEQGISYKAALETIKRFEAEPGSAEFAEAPPEVLESLGGVSRLTEGKKTELQKARAQYVASEQRKYETQQAAVSTLSQVGLITPEGTISASAFDLAETDNNIRAALINIGLTESEINQASQNKAVYQKYLNDKVEFEARYMPLADGKWVNKAEFNRLPEEYKTIGFADGFDAMKERIEQDQKKTEQQQEIVNQLRQEGYGSMAIEYPEGGAPFESYRTAPVNIVQYLRDNREKIDQAANRLLSAGFTKEQVSIAKVQATSSPRGGLKPFEGESKPPGWFEQQANKISIWASDFQPGGKEGQVKGDTFTAGLASAAEGAIGAGVTTLTAIPLLILRAGAKPKEVPSLALETGKGMVFHIGRNVSNLATGVYIPEVVQGNLYPMVYDTTLTALILAPIVKGVKGVANRITTYVAPRGIPFEAIGKEISTGRIETPEAFVKQYAEAMAEVEKLAMQRGGDFSGTVPIKGTPYELKYLKTPAEQVLGDLLFHGTKDVISEGQIITPSALRLAGEQGALIAPKAGIYTSPWAAIGYTRGGTNPGLLMILTDASKLKSGEGGLAKGLTQSDVFIRRAKPDFYTSSKVWRGDLETEIVGASGTKIEVPPPESGLFTRIVAGKYADFFTRDGGKFVPIKIGLDSKSYNPLALEALKEPSAWYAVKLYSLYGALRDTAEAFKHPKLMAKDITGTVKELFNIDRLVREGTGAKGTRVFPGVRDVYLQTNIGQALRMLATDIFNKAFRRTRQQLSDKVRSDSSTFRQLLERNMEAEYRSNASSIIEAFKTTASAYAASESAKSAFESSYLASLGLSSKSLASIVNMSSTALREVTEDVARSYPSTEASESYLRSNDITDTLVSSIRSEQSESIRTPETITPPSLSSIETPETPETRTIEIPETPEIPRTPPITPPSREIPETPPPPPPVVMRGISRGGVTYQPIPEGSIAFAMGKRKGIRGMLVPQWYYIPPPYNMDKPVSMSAPPIGAIRTDSANPYETIQVIGRSRIATVPQSISIDLGITDAFITDSGRTIRFGGKGQKTNVGRRIISNVRGMDILGDDIIDEWYPGKAMESEGLSRTKIKSKTIQTKKIKKAKNKRTDKIKYSVLSGVEL